MKRNEYHKIICAGDSSPAIYFDCFDTLLIHRYSPLHFFVCLSDWLIQNYHVQGDCRAIAKSLEILFSICSPFETTAQNVFIHYINSDTNSFPSFFESLKQTTMSLTRDLFAPAPLSQDLIKFFSQKYRGKPLFIVTDFYLGSFFLKPILDYYFGECTFAHVFSSSDYGCSKCGLLYQTAIKLGGDGLVVDDNYECCKKADSLFSYKPIWLNAQSQYRSYRRFNSNYYRIVRQQCKKVWNRDSATFASNAAFLIFDYCRRLYANARFGENIAFFSREGQFLKRCFDEYLLSHRDKALTTSYFLISRIAMLLPTIDFKTINAREFAKQFRSRCEWENLSLLLVLQIIGFAQEEIDRLSQECQCDFSVPSEDVFSQPEYQILWNSALFMKIFREKQEIAIERLTANLRSACRERFVLAELGFRGRMQNELTAFLPKDVETMGFYFGLHSCIGELPHSRKKGLLFEYGQGDYVKLGWDALVLEPLLRADHGQVVCYCRDEDRKIADSGLMVFDSYSRVRQELMFAAFQKLCRIDKITPIPQYLFSSFGIAAIKKRPKKCRKIDDFYGHLQCFGGAGVHVENFTKSAPANGLCRNIKDKIKVTLHRIRLRLHWY